MRRIKPQASRAVRAWMAQQGLMVKDIANAVGLKATTGTITHFLDGKTTSQPIRDQFVRLGCPERLMADLDAMRERQRQRAA